MKNSISKEWCEKMANIEDGQEIGAGSLAMESSNAKRATKELVEKNLIIARHEYGDKIQKRSIKNEGRLNVVVELNLIGDEILRRIPDYCNNIADTWPLVLKYGISFYKDTKGRFCAYTKKDACSYNQDPLTAIVDCIIGIIESEGE